MLHTKFQASKPSGSEEEDFLIFFYVFLWFSLNSIYLINDINMLYTEYIR